MKKIGMLSIVSIFLMFSTVLATRTYVDWDVAVRAGEWSNKTALMFDDVNTQVCSLTLTGDLGNAITVTNLPDTLNFTNNESHWINAYILTPTSASGTYSGSIKYCDARLNVIIDVESETTEGECDIMRDVYIDYFGGLAPGTKLMFYLRDKRYRPIDGTITITSAVGINPSEILQCEGGFCSYNIPPNEPGPLIAKVEIPDCGFKPIQIALSEPPIGSTSARKLTIDAPSTVTINENFVVTTRADGKLESDVVISVVGVQSTDRFFGRSDAFGSATFKLRDTGEYKIYAEKEGFNSTQITITAELPQCPYECCVDTTYQEKTCEPNYVCKENECKKKLKKEVNIACGTPEPGKKFTCRLVDYETGELIDEDVTGELITADNTTTPIDWISGIATITAPEQAFTITSDETSDYKEGIYEYTYPINWFWVIMVIIVVVVIMIVLIGIAIFLVRRWRRPKITYPSAESEFEEIIPA